MKKTILAAMMIATSVFANVASANEFETSTEAARGGGISIGIGHGGVSIGIGIGGGHGGGWGGGHGPGHHVVQCVARNIRGQVFVGYGYLASVAQREALHKCYYFSRSCYIQYCR